MWMSSMTSGVKIWLCPRTVCGEGAVSSAISALSGDLVELLGCEHQARGRIRSQRRPVACARPRVAPGAAWSRARSRRRLPGRALEDELPLGGLEVVVVVELLAA